MSRRRVAAKRIVNPDPRFGSDMLSKFMNMIMEDGKKSVAEKIVYGALDVIEGKGHKETLELVAKALENVQPRVEVKSRRVGGATYQVPVEVRPARSHGRPGGNHTSTSAARTLQLTRATKTTMMVATLTRAIPL